MGMVFQWLVRIASVMVLLVILAGFGVYFFASRSLPDYDKTLPVAGTSGTIEIVRDNANVPHIFPRAKLPDQANADAFFGLGYAHAQDRLWQMTILRRTAQGRLSEVFGKATLPTDMLMRRYDLHRLAQASVAAQTPRARAALEAYARGVNARLTEINTGALGRGAPEMFLFNAPIAQWKPADSIAILKLTAIQSSSHLQNEILRARVTLALGPKAIEAGRVADILPDAPGKGVAALQEYASLFPALRNRKHASAAPEHTHFLTPVPPRGMARASNAWAATPARSASGGTLLANDPHVRLTAPSAWYLARLELSSGGVIGGSLPGIPAILTGRSARLGWGITASYLDDTDIIIEQLNPANSEEYKAVQGYQKFRTRRSIIQVRDAEPVTLTLRWSDNGPILPGTRFDLATVTPPGHVAAISQTVLTDGDTTYSAAHDLMYARSIPDALDASRSFVAPAQNLILADRLTVAMKLIGVQPRRDAEHETKGRMPARGWIAANLWNGVQPDAANPKFVSPKGGIVGNTNNKSVDRPFPLHISHYWGDSQRINRWRRLMQEREVHTRDSFIQAQNDTVSFTARSLLPLVGKDLWFTGNAAATGTVERRRKQALDLLANWNGEMNEHLPEPLIYAAWMRFLQKRLIQDELGPIADQFTHLEPLFIERVFRNINGASAWCDVLNSSPRETCADMARVALDEALLWLTETYGTSVESLRWGDAHLATHNHESLSQATLLRHFVNIHQSTSGGDNTLQRGMTAGDSENPFHNVHGAGYRGVYDFADPDSSVFIIATGQSGHFLSRHYDDLAQLWRRGEYIPMSLDQDLARAASVGVTLLTPARP